MTSRARYDPPTTTGAPIWTQRLGWGAAVLGTVALAATWLEVLTNDYSAVSAEIFATGATVLMGGCLVLATLTRSSFITLLIAGVATVLLAGSAWLLQVGTDSSSLNFDFFYGSVTLVGALLCAGMVVGAGRRPHRRS